MNIKKSLLGSVTESGWWKQQRSAKGTTTASVEATEAKPKLGKVNGPITPPTVEGEPEQRTEGTMTGLFKKLDFF